ncbi:MAG: Homoserine kinase [Accumulibacter sp.]|uniref:homoserine kinase n=1 Tax=Accumulibacter sp. TaxID=2053492 RepID=UPI00122188A3|nr:homoserine kinase [Accumulibacter sp.]TLD44041.1 MAG: Homoserine kinase [Accumulibacter sp.]
MSVFTELSASAAAAWLENYSLGTLQRLEGIAEGVQNSNFFLRTSGGEYVLTLFEQVPHAQLPFYTQLLAHLSACGIPCPAPVANRRNAYLGELAGRPALIVSRLDGLSVRRPTPAQCAAIGAALAELHLAAQSSPVSQPHPRGTAWCVEVAAQLVPHLAPDAAALLADELRQQASRPGSLPRGIVHADLFRDNVLFVGDRVSGLLDFYFAGVDDLLFDLAVVANDWCTAAGGEVDGERCRSLLAAYQRRRPLTAGERAAWPMLLRAAALRFWLSRLQDQLLPRPGEVVTQRDPRVYQEILLAHRASGDRPGLGTPPVEPLLAEAAPQVAWHGR